MFFLILFNIILKLLLMLSKLKLLFVNFDIFENILNFIM